MKGQAAIEYIMMIAVVAMLTISVMTKIKTYMVDRPDSFLNSYLNSFQTVFGGTDTQGSQLTYKRFKLH
jgi:Flp pilus assembly pilin Flp